MLISNLSYSAHDSVHVLCIKSVGESPVCGEREMILTAIIAFFYINNIKILIWMKHIL